MDAIHLKSANTGINHDCVHPPNCMAKTPSPPAAHTHASCTHESALQTLIQLSYVCVSVFLIHTKTCINYILYMSVHAFTFILYTAVVTALTVGYMSVFVFVLWFCVVCCGMADIVTYEPASRCQQFCL